MFETIAINSGKVVDEKVYVCTTAVNSIDKRREFIIDGVEKGFVKKDGKLMCNNTHGKIAEKLDRKTNDVRDVVATYVFTYVGTEKLYKPGFYKIVEIGACAEKSEFAKIFEYVEVTKMVFVKDLPPRVVKGGGHMSDIEREKLNTIRNTPLVPKVDNSIEGVVTTVVKSIKGIGSFHKTQLDGTFADPTIGSTMYDIYLNFQKGLEKIEFEKLDAIADQVGDLETQYMTQKETAEKYMIDTETELVNLRSIVKTIEESKLPTLEKSHAEFVKKIDSVKANFNGNDEFLKPLAQQAHDEQTKYNKEKAECTKSLVESKRAIDAIITKRVSENTKVNDMKAKYEQAKDASEKMYPLIESVLNETKIEGVSLMDICFEKVNGNSREQEIRNAFAELKISEQEASFIVKVISLIDDEADEVDEVITIEQKVETIEEEMVVESLVKPDEDRFSPNFDTSGPDIYTTCPDAFFAKEFITWYEQCKKEDQKKIKKKLDFCHANQFQTAHPIIDTLRKSDFPNMKEIRVGNAHAQSGQLRILFARDHWQLPVILTGFVKHADDFSEHIRIADNLFQVITTIVKHLSTLNDRKFTEEELFIAMRACIKQDEIDKYKELILKHAKKKNMLL